VSAYGLGLLLLCCWEAGFSNYQIVHGLPPPPLSYPDRRDFLECWCSRHDVTVALGVSGSGDQTWGISAGRYSLAEDAQVRGLCSPGMRASPSTCRVSTSVGTSRRRVVVGGGVLWVAPQEELRGPSGYTPRGFTSSPEREAK